MLKEFIIVIIMVPIRAVFLWIITNLSYEQHKYIIAIMAISIIFLTNFLLSLINVTGFYGTIFTMFMKSRYLAVIISFFVIKIVYKSEWSVTILIWLIWVMINIPLGFIHLKLYNLFF